MNAVLGAYVTLAAVDIDEHPPTSPFNAIAPPNARTTGLRYGLAPGRPLYATSHPVVPALIFGIPLFGLPAASAVYGYNNVASCRDARAQLAARQAASSAAPPAEP